jgi:hypothetical protein
MRRPTVDILNGVAMPLSDKAPIEHSGRPDQTPWKRPGKPVQGLEAVQPAAEKTSRSKDWEQFSRLEKNQPAQGWGAAHQNL